jgi:hypothetical protein
VNNRLLSKPKQFGHPFINGVDELRWPFREEGQQDVFSRLRAAEHGQDLAGSPR